ncbi:MAG: hypothetical protein HYR85_10770 [Planctomycetes bacterium]|nr:hypothetical protein [Planctomycetota bacterium]MBI3844447.1 hypothetical protein [Planctomycetota bacterium]
MNPRRDPQVVRRRETILSRISIGILYTLGLYVLIGPLVAPNASGWTRLTEAFGETAVLRCAIGFLFVYFATLTREKYRMKFIIEDVLEALNTFLYGKDYRRHREAVEILLRSLQSSDRNLRAKAVDALEKITGQRFGDDPGAWRKWWELNQRTFRARVAGATPVEGSPQSPTA